MKHLGEFSLIRRKSPEVFLHAKSPWLEDLLETHMNRLGLKLFNRGGKGYYPIITIEKKLGLNHYIVTKSSHELSLWSPSAFNPVPICVPGLRNGVEAPIFTGVMVHRQATIFIRRVEQYMRTLKMLADRVDQK
jgi:hypothetical protein